MLWSWATCCSCPTPFLLIINKITKAHRFQFAESYQLQKSTIHTSRKLSVQPTVADFSQEDKTKYKWVEIGPDVTEAQKQAIAQLSPKITNRCKALLKQILCFSSDENNLCLLLGTWVKIMKPRRADWLVVLKELSKLDHPLFFEVAEFSLLEESFETNIRDYTKLIHNYGKKNRLQDAEKALIAMKRLGFTCDQVILTAMIDMYSKAGNLALAEDTFEEMKLLFQPLDKRSYGSMIMAYVRANMLEKGENLLREMEAQDTYAGKEVYKALLRAYSMIGDTYGAQRVFDAIQFACVSPDNKICALLINAYVVAGESRKARLAFDNMRKGGVEPSDKCLALILGAYEKENKLNNALQFLLDLERDGVLVGKEASEVLVIWFRRLGVVKEVELVLREYAADEANM